MFTFCNSECHSIKSALLNRLFIFLVRSLGLDKLGKWVQNLVLILPGDQQKNSFFPVLLRCRYEPGHCLRLIVLDTTNRLVYPKTTTEQFDIKNVRLYIVSAGP